jgi:hypothetical protein
MSARRPPVFLHVERLVVDGLPLTATQGARLQVALEGELARLVAARRDGYRGRDGTGDAGSLRSPPVVWEPTRPRQLGRALARSVFASLNLPAPVAGEPRGRS